MLERGLQIWEGLILALLWIGFSSQPLKGVLGIQEFNFETLPVLFYSDNPRSLFFSCSPPVGKTTDLQLIEAFNVESFSSGETFIQYPLSHLLQRKTIKNEIMDCNLIL